MPLLSDSSCLKKLHAANCDILSLPDNLFHYQLEEINLSGNESNGGMVMILSRSKVCHLFEIELVHSINDANSM